MNQQLINLIWCCDHHRQLEVGWILELLSPHSVRQIYLYESPPTLIDNIPDVPTVLVISGINWLGTTPNLSKIRRDLLVRQAFLSKFPSDKRLLLFHISDEQGLDAANFYGQLPSKTCVWRNFSHDHLDFPHISITSFPIGPRSEFLSHGPCIHPDPRIYPWSFLGTIWASGSRFKATSLFLSRIPGGYYLGGKSFGSGLPVQEYKMIMSRSIFVLCPEGDRHFDTFRLYESLCSGCLPLIVDPSGQAQSLLGASFPLPLFSIWEDALVYAIQKLKDKSALTSLQNAVSSWWILYVNHLRAAIHEDLRS